MSKACLEVTSSTCVVVATMHSILKKTMEDQQQLDLHNTGVRKTNISDDMVGILSMLEIVLLKIKSMNEPEPQQLLEEAILKMKGIVSSRGTEETANRMTAIKDSRERQK